MKNPLTTVLLTTIFLMLISNIIVAQYEPWSDPVSLTDSLTDNRNANMQFVRFSENDIYIFWEKSTDSLSTAIYYKRFYGNDEPEVFLSDEGIHYTNFQFLNWNNYKLSKTATFYAFYESDETGINRIYYRIYDNGFSEPQELTNSSDEQTNLLCNYEGRIVWMENNRIMHMMLDLNTFIFDDAVVIDSGDCSFPSISQPESEFWMGNGFPVVTYIKAENDSSKVKVRLYDQDDGWLDPITIFTGSQCSNLSFCNGMGPLMIITWDYYNDTSWYIITYDLEDPQMLISQFVQQEPFHPVFYSGIIPVKSGNYIEAGISSFIYCNNDTSDIYTAPFYYGANPPFDAYQNVSKSINVVNNPKVFSGERIGCNYYFINIWEEFVNNHWQLKYSISHECLSKIEENNESINVELKVNPNPISEEANISFSLDNTYNIILSIYNSSGNVIETLESTKLSAGEYSYIWSGNTCKPGFYFVLLQSELGLVSKKVVVVD